MHRAVERISLTGKIRRPLISIQGTLDALTPPATFGDVYDRMVTDAGRAPLHRYVHVDGGAHTDGLVVLDRNRLKPDAAVLRRSVRRAGGLGPPSRPFVTRTGGTTRPWEPNPLVRGDGG
ncbi:hypothetical protein [Streptomyces sp. NBC_01443]|uniref:hypothetical protein n=1 Tax=Streptomyces sp. NBC_01443 TaxID=2903868 RepID=UPI0022573BBD|nr:hypothetical protein [Streptomyces sp. NBC_01443]MCX4631665.1 hypothetical protein [Streptomyces sp. NBC_01443]